MAWRPAPTVRNPLLALRRVVEAPEPDGLEYVEVLGAAVAVAEWAPRGRVEHEHVELHSRSEDILAQRNGCSIPEMCAASLSP